MASAAYNNDTGNGDESSKISGQQKSQPVMSLLEKYSGLHRGIEEARKEYTKGKLEIESIEGQILRFVNVDRVSTKEAIRNAVREKQVLLQTLENLMLIDLVEAEEAESLAKSHLESVRLKEKSATWATQDDQNRFLNESKVFREKIRTLSLRGELFGLETPVALLSVYETLHGRVPSKFKETTNEEGKNIEDSGNGDGASLLINMDHDSLKNKNDEEIQDILEQLQTQNESNRKHEAVLQKKKHNYGRLLEAKEGKEKHKRGLQSQYERLQKDASAVESQIENLNQQTREAIKLQNRFRNDVDGEKEIETSGSNNARSTKNTTSTQLPSPGGKEKIENTINNHSTISKRKLNTTYNPYARPNRRKHCTAGKSERSSATTMISPVAVTMKENPKSMGINKEKRHTSSAEISNRSQHGDDHQSRSVTKATSRTNRQLSSIRSTRARSSRHFGESSFRTPNESMMKDTHSNKNDNRNQNTTTENKTKPGHEKRVENRGGSSMFLNLEDTDDDDSDDMSWLNGTPSCRP